MVALYYRAALARSLPAFLARYPGISVEQLLGEAGIDPARLHEREAVNDLRGAVDLFERAARLTKNEFFGLDFGTQMPWVDLGILGYVMKHAPTLGAGLQNAKRYSLVQGTHGGLTVELENGIVRVGYALTDPELRAHGQVAELLLALLVRFARDSTAEKSWGPRLVRLTRRAPADRDHPRRFFGVRCDFEQAHNELVFDEAELALPLESADPALLPILLQYAEDSLARMPAADGELSPVRRAVVEMLSAGECSIEHVAAGLHLSVRSLQRRLAEHERSFKELVEETRLALAQRYLEDPALSLTEIAFLLAYSDLSAFSRAFRRWTGESAQEARARLAR